jgi:hypothetical protein
MKQIHPYSEEQTLVHLAETRGTLAAIEERWKIYRQTSKELTVRLITEHGYSIAKAAELSGHHRASISIWLKVYNAENKAAQRPAAAAGAQGEE